MSGKTYTITQFSDALSRLDNHVRGVVLAKAAMAGGYVVETYAKINVTTVFKGGSHRTGNLAGSIKTTLESSTPTRAEVAVGPSVIYGRIQELGGVIVPVTAPRLHWVDESGIHHTAMKVTIPARPYLRPAVDDHEDKIIEAISKNLQIEIEGQI
jgi:phage gpG-like protein